MATGMFGANTEVLRTIAGKFGTAEDTVRGAGDTSLREVEGVEWLGTDADAFRAHYRDHVVTEINALAIDLGTEDSKLVRNADEQDRASGGGGGGGNTGPGREPGLLHRFFDAMPKWIQDLIKNPLALYPDLRNPLRGLRFLMEAGYALTHPGVFGKFFTTGWTGITGYVNGFGKTSQGIEAALEASRAGFLYKPLKWTTDMLQAKPLSVFLENKLAAGIDKAFGLDPIRKFIVGADGVADVSQLSRTGDAIQSFLGKEGRMLGRGLGAFSVGMDGYSTFTNIQDGNYGQAAYSGVKTALGVASFIPGPVGWTAAGISVGLAAYDNIPAVKNTVNAIGSGIAKGWDAITPW